MYIVGDMVYAGDPEPVLEVVAVRPLAGHMLWVRFNTGEAKTVDMKPLLHTPVFAPLQDAAVFEKVALDMFGPVWQGEIDIAPEYLYEHGIDAQ